jgi:uncharacterized protein (UPF0261 family)
MRTSPSECAQLGSILAEKINRYTGPVTVMIPEKAISVISASGQPFHDPTADAALFDALRSQCRKPVETHALEINDPAFAAACAHKLLSSLGA